MTRCWRKPDSRSRVTRPRFQDRLMSPLPEFPVTRDSRREREPKLARDGRRLPWDREFESTSLQRRVHCELAPHGFGAPVIGQQLALRWEAISLSGPTYSFMAT